MVPHVQRALVLIEQSRYELAARELRQALAHDPNDAKAHALLGLCLGELDQLDEATAEARIAISLAPDVAVHHFIMAGVLVYRKHFAEAEIAVEEALRLDPAEADYYGMLASIRLARREWQPALEAAEQGLAFDAEHGGCNNCRAMALVNLGRKAEAGATIAATLARNPEDAFSHANQGWTCLHQGDRRKALEHFREALRLDPMLDYARSGMVETLKAKNFIYAIFLRYFLWMSTLSRRTQWIVIIGGLIGYRLLSSIAERNPLVEPWIRPFLVLYLVFAVSTWVAYPLFNLLLRVHPYGRYALSRDQIVASNWIGILIAAALAALVCAFVTNSELAWLAALFFGILVLPVSGTFACDPGWPRNWMIAYDVALAALGAAMMAAAFAGSIDLAAGLLQAFFLGGVLSGFVANALAMATPRR